ncbi:KAP family P-loop NTPase fold protein [Leeuwenhoekiella sp. W20_SRS_FM14]|uniref:KAP family P-loop NTPase fold protein n=1 Tax=Leeuwenhoekiella sp. W20_SRS_FM14 TaxID=3240270 RepID=UPI003F9E879B
MKIKHDPIGIPDDGSDPFINCKLDRKPYAEALTNVVSTYADGFVMAVNNEWGAGKTTFIKMWKQQLKNEGFETLYFNAWENDFQDDVIIALLSELEELKNEAEARFDSVLKNAATFLRKVAPAVIKGAASKAIGDEAVTEIVEAVTTYTTEEVEEELKAFSEKKKGIQDFRKSLEAFVKKVDSKKPVVFFIDELGRCRPDYAVRVLERIKHLFSVPGIVFVLSIDKEQLGHAVCGYYGSDNINAAEYLRRFIDLEFNIPEANQLQYIEYLLEYYDFKSFTNKSFRQVPPYSNDQSRLRNISKMLFSQEEFKLRLLHKCFARIRLTISTFPEHQDVLPDLIVLLSFLYEKYPKVYMNLENTKYSIDTLAKEFDNILLPFRTKDNFHWIFNLYASLLVKYNNQLYNKYKTQKMPLIQNETIRGTVTLTFQSSFETEGKLANSIAHFVGDDNYNVSLVDIQKRYSLSKYSK